MTHIQFNPPPGWPPCPPGWIPPIGWQAPREWPDPPEDWVLYLESPSNEPARLDSRSTDEYPHQHPSWWSEGPGYHAAYFAEPPQATSRRWGLDAWPVSRQPRDVAQTPSAVRLYRKKWLRRIGFTVIGIAILFGLAPLLNSPVSRAILACENAVTLQAIEAKIGEQEASGLEADPLLAARYSRSEMRYNLVESGSTDLVTITGDYLPPGGEWSTFTCTARHDVTPAKVVDVSVVPVSPVSPGNGLSSAIR